jgi:Fe-S cluster biogenesis protein NfuA
VPSKGINLEPLKRIFIKNRHDKGGIMKDKVEKVLDEIRPMLIRDGGNVELVSIDEGVVKVRLQGACAGCPMSQMTLRNGIERVLKEKIPEVVAVEPA